MNLLNRVRLQGRARFPLLVVMAVQVGCADGTTRQCEGTASMDLRACIQELVEPDAQELDHETSSLDTQNESEQEEATLLDDDRSELPEDPFVPCTDSAVLEIVFSSSGTDIADPLAFTILGGRFVATEPACSCDLDNATRGNLATAAAAVTWKTVPASLPCSDAYTSTISTRIRMDLPTGETIDKSFSYCEERSPLLPSSLTAYLTQVQNLSRECCGADFPRIFREPNDVYLSDRESFDLVLLLIEGPGFQTDGGVLLEVRDGYLLLPGYHTKPVALPDYDRKLIRDLALSLPLSNGTTDWPSACFYGVPKFELSYQSFTEAGTQDIGDVRFCLVDSAERLDTLLPNLMYLTRNLYGLALRASGRRLTVPPVLSELLSSGGDMSSQAPVDVTLHWTNGLGNYDESEGLFGGSYWFSDNCVVWAVEPAQSDLVAGAAAGLIDYMTNASPSKCVPDTPTTKVAMRAGNAVLERIFCEVSDVGNETERLKPIKSALATIRSAGCGY